MVSSVHIYYVLIFLQKHALILHLLALISEVQPQRHRSIEIELKRRVKRKGFKRDRMSSDMSFVFLTQSAERLSLYVMI